ncbi:MULTISPECIES: hypothetical protein [Heyndrickxia]|nr:hypothetical protein [Heyndrickxia shackletonii]
MLFSYEQIEIAKLIEQDMVRKNRHRWGYFQRKNERQYEGK